MAAQEDAGPQEVPAASPEAVTAAPVIAPSAAASVDDILASVTSSNPVSLNLSNDGLNVSLSVLDGDLVKQAIATLVATVKSQNEKVGPILGSSRVYPLQEAASQSSRR